MFLLVPAIAPALGQVILHFFQWRMIFWIFVGLATIAWIWLAVRQAETLAPEQRRPLSLGRINKGFVSVLKNKTTMVYTVAAGLVFGAFIGFLNSAQQILQELYGLGNQFAAYFAVLALTLGTASYLNAKLVLKLGMRMLCRVSLSVLSALSLVFWVIASLSSPSLYAFMAYLMPSFLMIGLLFGNFNALAMEPQGHQAGLAAALIGSLSSLLSLGLGYLVGASYNNSVIPLVAGFAILSLAALALTSMYEKRNPIEDSE